MAKFEKVAKKRLMVRFLEIDGKTGVWATCSEAVKDYAKKTFKEGDIVDVQSDPSGELGLHVTRISKPGQGGGGSPAQSPANTELICPDCGKAKEAKYEKCWSCNKKNPSSKTKDRGSDVNTSIKRQAIGHMTSRSLIAMQGHVDPNNIVGLVETLYAKYKELVG